MPRTLQLLLQAHTAVRQQPLEAQALLLPLVWLPLLPLGLGVSWLLAALGTYVRDVGHAASLAMSALLFLSPIFYPLEALPAAVRPWLHLNPLALPIEFTRELVTTGTLPDAAAYGSHLAASVAFAVLAALLFHRLRPGFADVV